MQQQRLAEMLAASDPPQAVELLLRFLVDCQASTAGAVLRIVGGEPIALEVLQVSPQRLAVACAAWKGCEDGVVSDDFALLALRDGDELVGLLYLDAPQRAVDTVELAALLAALAKALRNTTGYEERPRLDDRALLRRVLRDAEWNISRAARAMGVTRRTVYQRLRRFGIPLREKA
jgi:hypothetical protein